MVVWDTSRCVLGLASLLIGVACWRFDGGRRIVPNFSSRLLATQTAPSVPVHRLLRPTESITNWEIDFKSELVKPWRAISNRFFSCGMSSAAANVHIAIRTDDQLHSIGTVFKPNIDVMLNASAAFAVLHETDAVRKVRTEIGSDHLQLSLDGEFSAISTEQSEQTLARAFQELIVPELFPHAGSIFIKFRKFTLNEAGDGHSSVDAAHAADGTFLIAAYTKLNGGKLTIGADDGSLSKWTTDWDFAGTRIAAYVDWCAFHTNLTSNFAPVNSGTRAVLQFDITVIPRAADAITEGDEEVVDYGEHYWCEDDLGYYSEDNALKIARNPLCESNGWSITATPTAVDSFLKRLQPHLQNQSIALPLFNSYQQAYLRPDFLKSADRTLFDALLASGRSVLLTPVVLSSKSFLNSFGPTYEAAPTDPYDEVYSQRADGEIAVSKATFISHPEVKYIWTNHMQHDKYFRQKCGGASGNEWTVPEEYRYLSAAMVILSDSVVLQQEDKSQVIKPAKQE